VFVDAACLGLLVDLGAGKTEERGGGGLCHLQPGFLH
jgi:hypothetical protein